MSNSPEKTDRQDISGDTSADLPVIERSPHTVLVRAPGRSASIGLTPEMPLSLDLPGSKYYTLRFLLNALLADGESLVRFPAVSDDTAVLVHALRCLGAQVVWEPIPTVPGLEPWQGRSADTAWQLRVRGTAGRLSSPEGPLPMGNAGAVLRLLLGLGALLPEVTYVTDHPHSLGRRPNADLLTALGSLGVAVEAQGAEGCLPITLRGGDLQGGMVTISGKRSSQYLSALLYLAPQLPQGLDIRITDELRSQPLVRATLRALAAAGISLESASDLSWFHVPGKQMFRASTFDVPGDGPTAAALLGAACVLNRSMQLRRLAVEAEDVKSMLVALRALGARFSLLPEEGAGLFTVQLQAPVESGQQSQLCGADIDGDTCIDSVPVLVAVACFAQGESRFRRVGTLRLKESDRIADLCSELGQAGAWVDPGEETITVHGRPQGISGGVLVSGHDDHRLIQALAIAALRSADGITVAGAEAVAKSYPEFFAVLASCGAEVQAVETGQSSPPGREHSPDERSLPVDSE
jgi:3-phosphoshikimate 1-carboxyvinyltransferase